MPMFQATKDSKNYTIPIVDTYELKFLGTMDGYESVESGISVNKSATNIGGKGYDETCTTITVPAGTTLSNKSRVQVDGINNLNSPKTTVTAEFDVLVSGDVDADVYCDSGYELMQINHTGTATYPVFSTGTSVNWKDSAASYPAGEWHHVAITYDYAGARIMTYIDGTMLSSNGWYIPGTMGDLGSLRLGVKNGTYAEGGYVAYDNIKINRGYYTKRNTAITLSQQDENVYSIDASNGTINAAYGVSVDALKSSLTTNTDAYKVRVYAEDTKTAAATEINDNTVVTLVSPDKITYTDYVVAEAVPTPFQKTGLTVASTYPKCYHYAKSDTESSESTQVTNYYVKATEIDDEDTLAVYSNENQVEYAAYAWRVLETLSSTKGYTFSIWNSTKTVERTSENAYVDGTVTGLDKTDLVKGGDFLKAEKDDDVVWIPIVNKTNVVTKTDLVDNGGGATTGDASSWGLTSTATGIGDKDADDTSMAIATDNTSGNVQIGANQSKVSLDGYEAYSNIYNKSTYTWVMSIYPTEGSSFNFLTVYNSGGSQDEFFSYKDGKITINKPDGTTEEMKFATNKWHRVALSTDTNRYVCQLWIDGVNMLSAGTQYQPQLLCTRIGLNSDNAGAIYFDDLLLYKGYYDVDSEFDFSPKCTLDDFGAINKDGAQAGIFFKVTVNTVNSSLTLGFDDAEFTITELGDFDCDTSLTYAILGKKAANITPTSDITITSGEEEYEVAE